MLLFAVFSVCLCNYKVGGWHSHLHHIFHKAMSLNLAAPHIKNESLHYQFCKELQNLRGYSSKSTTQLHSAPILQYI